MNPLDELKFAIQSGGCVLVLGTGISAAISENDQLTSWKGLLASGIQFAASTGSSSDREWEESITSLLNDAVTADDYLVIGQGLIEQLNLNGGGEFGRWLRDGIGGLIAKESGVAEALDRLDLPIVTTNYDSLFEQSTGREPITWRENANVQLALTRRTKDVVHLHGYWRDPNSIILSSSQYELMLADQSTKVLRQAMAAINSMVYVGFGAGMSDPTFTQLREWILGEFPNQELLHFRLCTNAELDSIAAELKGETIRPVSYGESFSDLAPFLSTLIPANTALALPDPGPELGAKNVRRMVQETSLLSTHLNLDDAKVDQLLIPPVLLPIPHEQYVREPKNQEQKVTRSNLELELENPRLLIVGEENVGVSGALLWLTSKAATKYSEAIPLFIDYQRIDAGIRPLHRRIRQELRGLGIEIAPNDPIPKIFLTLDNLSLAKPERWKRVAEELDDPNIVWTAMGCHRGSEIEILQVFPDEIRQTFHTLYVGRLNKADVLSMAKLVSPRLHEEIAEKAIDLVRSQHLPRTPFTFSMILGALLRGESLIAATSTTTLLDAYVQALLGRGAIADDPRIGLDAFGRTVLLSTLSALFVERQLGELHADEVASAVKDLFDRYDWPYDPVTELKDLQDRKVLILKGATVSFTQTGYLHLFAAKYAMSNESFLEYLKTNPLYYAPIISHYASLKRSDQELLRSLAELVKPFLDEEVISATAWRRELSENGVIKQRKNVEASEQLEHEVLALPENTEEFEPLDEQEEMDLAPFPLQPIEDLPPIPRLVTTLGLISNLLRDTEVMEDQDLKKSVLKDVLLGWAQLISRIEQTQNFDEISLETAKRLAAELKIPNRHLDNFVREIVTMLPLAFGMSGISSSLSSQKLVRAVLRGLTTGDLMSDVRTAILGVYFLVDVGSAGWSEPLETVLGKYSDVPAVGLTLRRLVLMSYVNRDLSETDEVNAQEFLVDQMLLERFGSHQERQQHKGRFIANLKKFRLQRSLVSKRAISKGDTEV